jgi:transposase-like protein
VVVVAVRRYLRYGLSYRDVEELLAERGIAVDHVTIYRWVQRFTPLLADAARFSRHLPGDRWYVDETYVKVNGVWRYVYRAVDQHGQVIDVLLTVHRDAVAARRFFTRALRTLRVIPSEVVTDAAPVYPSVLAVLVPAAWRPRSCGRSSTTPRWRTASRIPGSCDGRSSSSRKVDAKYPHATIQVVTCGACAARSNSFSMLRLRATMLAEVVYLEHLNDALFLDDSTQSDPYRLAWTEIAARR